MKEIDICCGGAYASSWGLTDFYEACEKALKDALESGEDFDTGWFGCKKEIHYARYVKRDGNFEITVTAHMDDLYEEDDLIYDALWEVAKSEEELPQETIDSIRECAMWDGIEDSAKLSESIPAEKATFEEIVDVTNWLEQGVDNINHGRFKQLCEIVKNHVCIEEDAENG